MKSLDVIVACDIKNGIGKNGHIPWLIQEDMEHFRNLTIKSSIGKSNAVIMGRKTWESIPSQHRPLTGRFNIVVSSSSIGQGVITVNSFEEALKAANAFSNIERVFVIGGQRIYEEALQCDCIENVYLTRVHSNFDCDVWFPPLLQDKFQLTQYSEVKETIEGIKFSMTRYVKKDIMSKLGEFAYLSLLRTIIDNGVQRQTRNAQTLSIFGERLEFDLREGFPLMTTRGKIWVKGIFEELMWIIRGSTNVKDLQDRGVHIWDPNSTREFLDKRGLSHLKEGDIGNTYGHVLRHFGAGYDNCETDYTGQGVDQLYDVIDKIKNDPSNRRIIMSLWDPSNVDKCALPPCLRDYQFYVEGDVLHCQATLRSSDSPVALHWNICTVGLMMLMLGKICNKVPGRLIMVLGDAHIYVEHLDGIKQILDRQPTTFPKLELLRKPDKIEDFEFSDLRVVEYYPQTKKITLNMIA